MRRLAAIALLVVAAVFLALREQRRAPPATEPVEAQATSAEPRIDEAIVLPAGRGELFQDLPNERRVLARLDVTAGEMIELELP